MRFRLEPRRRVFAESHAACAVGSDGCAAGNNCIVSALIVLHRRQTNEPAGVHVRGMRTRRRGDGRLISASDRAVAVERALSALSDTRVRL